MLKDISSLLGNKLELIQASGGNTSYKENGIMWIKASGKSLASSKMDDIFIPLAIDPIINSIISKTEIETKFKPLIKTDLKASIETGLHAVIPYSFVLHTHPLDVIALSVVEGSKALFSRLLDGIDWTWIDYVKPGEALSKVIYKSINDNLTKVFILKNHGLIVAGDDIDQALDLQNNVLSRLKTKERNVTSPNVKNLEQIIMTLNKNDINAYLPDALKIHSLATDSWSMKLAKMNPLYPDHLVFCGLKPLIHSQESIKRIRKGDIINFTYSIIKEVGVILFSNCTQSTHSMLEAQSIINLRIPPLSCVNTLSNEDCNALCNWDAELYRIKISKSNQ